MAVSKIAIVGMSAAFAECSTPDELWRNLQAGRESVGKIAAFDEAAAESGAGHWVEATVIEDRDELFDASLFGLSPRETERIEPQQRIFLEAAWEAMEDGGCSPAAIGPRVGVFGGANFTSFYSLTADSHMPEALDEMIGSDKDYIATRVAHHLGLQGPALTVQSACSTSLVAVHVACQSLRAGECDAAIAGGVSVTKPRMTKYFYTPGGILSPDGRCRAFDADALGTVFTEGVGALALMRLEDAVARRHPIYAVIRGSAINNDGGGKTSYMAPSIAGQERVLRDAYRAAKVDPKDVGYVEGHGTATVLGDAIELAALTRVFRSHTDDVGFCQLGSVKTNIGHTVSAAGVAGLIKAALALRHEAVPPNAGFVTPNPDLDLETSPFFVSAEPRAWPRKRKAPRYAGVSSFGVGGTNAHVVLEEAPVRAKARARRSHYVLTLSAASDTALAAAAERLRARLKGVSRSELADIAYTLNVGRRELNHRAAIVCADVREARNALAGRVQSTAFNGRITPGARSIAFMFPGQGSQYVGMGRQLYASEATFREVVDRCLKALGETHGPDLAAAFRAEGDPPDEAFITRTEIAQQLIFIVEYALGALLMSWGVKPNYAIGHSVGEFAAAALAGVFRLEDALGLVVLRGRLMQAMAPGAMLSVAAPSETLEAMLPADLDLAAVNGPRQCVVSGPSERLDAFAAELMEAQIHSVRLRTSHAFHSRMMEPMLEAFRRAVAGVEVRPPSFPLVSNESGDAALWEALRDPDYWARHIRAPVRFAQGLQTLVGRGVDLLLEVGPGRQLSGLAQQCGLHRQGIRIINTMHNDGAVIAEESVLTRAVSRIWLEGGAIDWAAMHGAEKRQMVALPRYPFERERFAAPAPGATPGARKGKLGVDEWLNVQTWRRALLGPAPAADLRDRDDCWLTFEDDNPLAGRLSAGLKALGQPVVSVRPGAAFQETATAFTVDPTSAEDYRAVFDALKAKGLTPRRIVHDWTLGRRDEAEWRSPAEEPRIQVLGLHSLAQILKAFHEVYGREPVTFNIVVSGAFDVTGGEQLFAEGGSVVGFARVAPQETLRLSCRLLDLDADLLGPTQVDAAATQVVQALMSDSDRVIALRGEYWWRQDFERCPIAPDREAGPRIKPGGVYLITGGLGHIGMIFARHLAKAWNARLVLVGRSPLEDIDETPAGDEETPSPTRRERLAEINALGGEAVYVQADVSVLENVQRLRAVAHETFGGLDGLILGAGSIEAPIAAQDIDAFEAYRENFSGKYHGFKNALTVFGDDPLDFAVLVSSISTVLGGLGHIAYAGANHMADLLLLQHRRLGHPNWMTSNWDLWAGGKVSAADPRVSWMIDKAIRPEEGAQALMDLLSLPQLGQVVIATHDLQTRIDTWIRGVIPPEDTRTIQHKRPNLAAAYVEVEGELEQRLAKLWSQILGIDPIGRDDDFFEMGGHSLLAVRIAVQVQDFMPPDAPGANLYETPTIRTLAEALLQRPFAQGAGATPLEAVS
jgi:phthiocerol/phenolphthiocerol synthesis type-I polyketide synthase E